MVSALKRSFLAGALIAALATGAGAAEPDWGKVPSSKVLLFYPGVVSWEFLTSDDHRLGMREIKQGRKECRHCHLSAEGELDLKADEIASGAVKMKKSQNPFEPEPMQGKKGTMIAALQAAYDDEFIYVKVEWESAGAGWNRKNPVSDRVSLQVNKSEAAFRKYGCFISCHNDANTMPASPPKKLVSANQYYGGLERDDVRLYAYYARTSWSEPKPEKELSKLLKEGGRISVWSAELIDGHATAMEGTIFDDRLWRTKPGLDAHGSWANGTYSVVFKQRLKSRDPYDVSMAAGDAVSFGLSIHDNGSAKRRHYVSFPFTIGLGANADIKAAKISK